MASFEPITENIFWVGVNDRQTDLFESLWPLPEGIAYNSYLIRDEKVALIDGVKGSFSLELLEKIRAVLGPSGKVDYLVINHMEPDHSGAIGMLRAVYPEIQIVGNKKTLAMLKQFHSVGENVIEVDEKEPLSLGRHRLSFHLIPMVHWPETMVTYESTEKVLFSCDAFGSYGVFSGGLFDDRLDLALFDDEALRYYANIVGGFSAFVQKALAKVRTLDLSILCPSHGPVWRKNPGYVIERYDEWSRQAGRRGVLVAYGSMYGQTAQLAEAVGQALVSNGIEEVVIRDTARTHSSYLLRDAWRYRGLVLAGCTYDMGLFPPLEAFVALLAAKKVKNKTLGLCGSYSWSRGVVLKKLKEIAVAQGWQCVEPEVEIYGVLSDEALAKARELGGNLAGSLG